MLIIAGYVIVDADKRDEIVAAHQEMVQRARTFEGCLDLSITADPIEPTRFNNFELWDSEASLEKWRKVANAPDVDIEQAEVKKYEISSVGEPF